MKIQNINYRYVNIGSKKIIFTSHKKETYPKQDSQIAEITTLQQQSIEAQKRKNENEYDSFINKKGKVSYEEYQDIINKNPTILVMAKKEIEKNKSLLSSPKTIAKTAILLKSYFDKKYNSNYRVISMGTSPAVITEVMQAIGADVIYAPISGLTGYISRKPDKKYRYNLENYPNIEKLLKYLQSKGVNENDTKTNILIDYCSTGASLILLRDMIVERNNIPRERLHDYSITILLDSIRRMHQNKSKAPNDEEIMNIVKDMQYNVMEKACNVPHFHIRDYENSGKGDYIESEGKSLDELFQEFDDYSKPEARVFILCAIDEAIKLNKKNPD